MPESDRPADNISVLDRVRRIDDLTRLVVENLCEIQEQLDGIAVAMGYRRRQVRMSSELVELAQQTQNPAA